MDDSSGKRGLNSLTDALIRTGDSEPDREFVGEATLVLSGKNCCEHSELRVELDQFQLCGCGATTVFVNGGGFNSQTVNQAILTSVTTPATYQTFNPFTQTPVEGVNWAYGPTFGQAQNRFAYTTPRTLRLTFGVRF